MILAALALALLGLLLALWGAVRVLLGRRVRGVLEAVLSLGRWAVLTALFLMCLGAALVAGGLLLILGVFLGYLTPWTAACLCFLACLVGAVAARLAARREKERVLGAVEGR